MCIHIYVYTHTHTHVYSYPNRYAHSPSGRDISQQSGSQSQVHNILTTSVYIQYITTSVYRCVYIYICVCVCTYIYTERESQRERDFIYLLISFIT